MSRAYALLKNRTPRKSRRGARNDNAWSDRAHALTDSCHPKQRAFVLDRSRRVAALTGGRCGKTTGGLVRLLVKMLNKPGADCLFIAETRLHAEELVWSNLKDILERVGISARYYEAKLVCVLENGSKLKLAGADNKRDIDKLRGIPRDEVGIDEAASHNPRILNWLIDRVLGPRLGDYRGTLWMAGTPGHIFAGRFYEVTMPDSKRTDWSVHRWNIDDGAPYVANINNAREEAYVEKKKQGWTDDNPVWLREWKGVWVRDDTENVFKYAPHKDGKPWNQWDPPRRPDGFAVLPKGDWQYVYGLDMGHSDPFALVILAHEPRSNRLLHVYEYQQRGMSIRDIAELLAGKEWCAAMLRSESCGDPEGLFGVTGWPYGIVSDITHLGGKILDELRTVYGIPIEPAKQKDKHDSIELTNGDMVDGRIKIMKDSALETQVMSLQWDIDEHGKLKAYKGQRDDLADALIYARAKAMNLLGESETQERSLTEAEKLQEQVRDYERRITAGDFEYAPPEFSDEW